MASPTNKVTLQTGAKLFPTVAYELMPDGYGEQWADGQSGLKLHVRTDWSESTKWATNMLGCVMTATGRTSGVSRFTPVVYPDVDFQPILSDPEVNAGSATNGRTAPFLGYYCTQLQYVGDTEQLSLQDQATGALVATKIRPQLLQAGTDYDAGTGALLSPADGYAEYMATFEPLMYEVRTDAQMDALGAPLNACELSRNVVREFRFGGNQFTIPGNGLLWRYKLANQAGYPTGVFPVGSQIPTGYPRIFPEVNMVYKWLAVPGIPWTAINNCIGKVNNTLAGANAPGGAFDYQPDWQNLAWARSPINGFPPGTVLFLGASEIQPYVSATGQFLYNISYAFSYRPDGHDRIYNSAVDDGVSKDELNVITPFRRVVRSASAKLPSGQWKGLLDEADLTTLFRLT